MDRNEFSIATQDTGRGILHTVNSAASRESILFGTGLPESVGNLKASLEAVANASIAENWNANYTADGIQKQIRKHLSPVPNAYQAAQKDVQDKKRVIAKRFQELDMLPSAYDASLESDFRHSFNALDMAGKAAMIDRASEAQLASYLRAGRDAMGLDATLWKRAQDRYRLLSIVRKTGLQANFATQPSLENPTAFEPDFNAATEHANKMVDALIAEREALDDATGALSRFAVVIGVMLSVTPQAAFDWLCGNVSEI